ncbi:Hydrocephalus-inducing protein (Protein Hy-3) [Durusdinium trenchii]|uniref:Hydrocephalus-inducing protein (Protein Hy-3) n=1 Tax=Durusdinium trenchii TaxID=1381693 RepID=A0ABP0NSI3_9DINO
MPEVLEPGAQLQLRFDRATSRWHDRPRQIFYMPLTMTAGGDSTGSPSSGKPRVEKHKGTIFLGTPDGNAVCYELEGEASPPEVGSRIDAKVPCKKKHTQAVPVKNWLHERQGASIVAGMDYGSYSCRVGFATHEAGDAERAELEEAEEAELRLAVPEGPGGSRRWSAVLEETG